MSKEADTPKEPEETQEGSEEQEISPDVAEAAEAAVQAVEDLPPLNPEEEMRRLEEQYMRVIADMENLRRRTERDIQDTRKYAIANFAQDLIAVLENLKRAEESIPADEIESNELFKNISDGVMMTRNELLNVFKKHGIERLDPVGEKFDHNFHQAMVEIPSNEHEPGTIVEVMQAGYTIKDRLLRPAMVGVAKAAEEEKQ